jgi:hypothetical protein
MPCGLFGFKIIRQTKKVNKRYIFDVWQTRHSHTSSIITFGMFGRSLGFVVANCLSFMLSKKSRLYRFLASCCSGVQRLSSHELPSFIRSESVDMGGVIAGSSALIFISSEVLTRSQISTISFGFSSFFV